jgi:hypothetical protein
VVAFVVEEGVVAFAVGEGVLVVFKTGIYFIQKRSKDHFFIIFGTP